MNKLEFDLTTEHIELYKLIKYFNLVETGGQSKYLIAEGAVNLNGELETRKRKKIVKGDIVTFMDYEITVK